MFAADKDTGHCATAIRLQSMSMRQAEASNYMGGLHGKLDLAHRGRLRTDWTETKKREISHTDINMHIERRKRGAETWTEKQTLTD